MFKENYEPINTTFLILSPIATLILVPYLLMTRGFELNFFIMFTIMYWVTGISITGGYHRLFAHKAYEAGTLVKLFYLIFGAAAIQNSAIKWANDHRRHHLKCDKEEDPYNINVGFLYAHILWVMQKEDTTKDYVTKDYSPDLKKDKLLQWQKKYYFRIGITVGFIIPTIIGHFMGSALSGLVYGGLARVVLVHHCTFLINSLAHTWGKATYTDQNTARDSLTLAIFSYGEGYHNYHHLFQADYRNGIKWYQYDPTKWMIYGFHKLGLVKNLKRSPESEILKAKLNMEHKRMLAKKDSVSMQRLTELKQKVLSIAEHMSQLEREFKILKKKKSEQLEHLKTRLKEARRELRQHLKMWQAERAALLV